MLLSAVVAALVSVFHQVPPKYPGSVIVHFHYPNSVVGPGTLVVDLAKKVPGFYVAYPDANSLPKIDQMDSEKRKTYDGTLYILNYFSEYPDRIMRLGFKAGRYEANFEMGDFVDKKVRTVDDLLSWLPKRADVRYGDISYLRLPKDVDQLKGFQGSLLFPSPSHGWREGDSFWAGIKDGKIAWAKDNLSN